MSAWPAATAALRPTMAKTTRSDTGKDVVGSRRHALSACARPHFAAGVGFVIGQRFTSDLVLVLTSNSEVRVGNHCTCLNAMFPARPIEIVVVCTRVIPGKGIFCFRKMGRLHSWCKPLMRRPGIECGVDLQPAGGEVSTHSPFRRRGPRVRGGNADKPVEPVQAPAGSIGDFFVASLAAASSPSILLPIPWREGTG